MKAPKQCRTTTRLLFMMGLQATALLLLQSCNNDRAEREKTQTEDPQQRAVFGSVPERAASGSPTPRTSPEPGPEAARSQDRARTAEPVTPESPANSDTAQRSSVKDPGERRVGDAGVGVAANRSQQRQAADRFLHYDPPGSSVGDTGELARKTPEPQGSTSMKPVQNLIRRWADTLLTRDLSSHMSLYAATLARFKVPRTFHAKPSKRRNSG